MRTAGLDSYISSDALAQKLLHRFGQNYGKEREKLDNRADVDKLFLRMAVKKTIADIISGMLEAVQDVRNTFGNDILPVSFDHIMQQRVHSGSFVCDALNDRLQSDPQLILAQQDIKDLLWNLLAEAL